MWSYGGLLSSYLYHPGDRPYDPRWEPLTWSMKAVSVNLLDWTENVLQCIRRMRGKPMCQPCGPIPFHQNQSQKLRAVVLKWVSLSERSESQMSRSIDFSTLLYTYSFLYVGARIQMSCVLLRLSRTGSEWTDQNQLLYKCVHVQCVSQVLACSTYRCTNVTTCIHLWHWTVLQYHRCVDSSSPIGKALLLTVHTLMLNVRMALYSALRVLISQFWWFQSVLG